MPYSLLLGLSKLNFQALRILFLLKWHHYIEIEEKVKRKILTFYALSALAFGAQNACEEYVNQSKIYLNELYEIKSKQLKDDPQA